MPLTAKKSVSFVQKKKGSGCLRHFCVFDGNNKDPWPPHSVQLVWKEGSGEAHMHAPQIEEHL